jgi:hypothetical protein
MLSKLGAGVDITQGQLQQQLHYNHEQQQQQQQQHYQQQVHLHSSQQQPHHVQDLQQQQQQQQHAHLALQSRDSDRYLHDRTLFWNRTAMLVRISCNACARLCDYTFTEL